LERMVSRKWLTQQGGLTKTNYELSNTEKGDVAIAFGWRVIVPEQYDTINGQSLAQDFTSAGPHLVLRGAGSNTEAYQLRFDDLVNVFGGVSVRYDAASRSIIALSLEKTLASGEVMVIDPSGGKWDEGAGVEGAIGSNVSTVSPYNGANLTGTVTLKGLANYSSAAV
ncbi:hypothetical protein COY28_02520, partial [Candidatus Woesearchaeota archaeon CG_4_10_14_0_2_um_filter_57_5]